MNGIQNKSRITISVLTFIFGILVVSGSSTLEIGTLNNVKPGFIPMFFGITIIILSLIMAVKELLILKKSDKSKLDLSMVQIGKMVGVFLIYATMIYWFGFVISTLVCISIAGHLLGLNKKSFIFLTLITTASTYILFEKILRIPLPSGILF